MKLVNLSRHNMPIKSWAIEDRPREKLLHKGRNVLSDAELLAIIIGSGSKNESVLSLAKRMLNAADNNLGNFSRWSIGELTRFKGIGQAKAVTIAAVMELANRKQFEQQVERPKILTSSDAVKVIRPILIDLNHEEFWILILNARNHLIDKKLISVGGINKTVVDHRILFKKAIESNAASIILCHNHPSGEVEPSDADLNLTARIEDSGSILGIKVIDHIIIAGNQYFSFEEEELLRRAA